MTRQLEPNQEMARLNAQSDTAGLQKEIGYIVSLFQYKNMQLKVIGDQFVKHVWTKDPTTICLCLLALYEELNAIIHVTQRLLICYLIYRLKDIWKLEGADKNMFSHPYLLIFVKIYWNYASPPGTNIKDRSLLHLLGEFPKVTAQEAYFVGRILTSPPHILKGIFELSPTFIANDPIGADQTISIEPLKVFVEQQLRQFPFFEAVLQSTSTGLPPRQSAFSNPTLFPSLQKIVLSLVSPSAAHASLNNNHLNSRNAPPGPPPGNPTSRRNLINSSYGFFSAPSNTPPGIVPRPSNANPPNSSSNTSNLPPALAKLFSASAMMSPNNSPTKSVPKPLGFFNQKSGDSGDDIDKMNAITFGDAADSLVDPIDLTAGERMSSTMFPSHDNHFSGPNARLSPTASLVPNPAHFSLSYVPERDRPMPDPIGTPLSAKRKSESKSPSPPQLNKLDEMSENRKFAFDMLKKIVEGNGGSLSKSQVTRLLNVLNADKDILPMVEISTRDFGQIVDSQPDLAAEILLQIHSAGSSNVYKLLDILLEIELSVQSLVSVSRFISSCERNSLYIPEEFLNAYITHCIQSCEKGNPNLPLIHRLVRMVCVFFSTLIRLSSFNIRPRITEMQNFATVFSAVKETSQLYQAITQMK